MEDGGRRRAASRAASTSTSKAGADEAAAGGIAEEVGVHERKAVILHVDDDEANRYAVTRSLKAGYDVVEAADGGECCGRWPTTPTS